MSPSSIDQRLARLRARVAREPATPRHKDFGKQTAANARTEHDRKRVAAEDAKIAAANAKWAARQERRAVKIARERRRYARHGWVWPGDHVIP